MLIKLAWREAGSLHPQGRIPAPVGATYVQLLTPDGLQTSRRLRYFDKIGGANSPWGWYPRVLASDTSLLWRGGLPAHTAYQGVNAGAWQEDNWASTEAGLAVISPETMRTPWYACYSAAAVGSSLLRWQLTGAPVVQRLDGTQSGTNMFLDWDLIVPIFPSPTNFSLDAVPALPAVTWIAALVADVAQTAAGMVTSDTLATAFPLALTGNPNRGVALRHEAPFLDVGWIPIVSDAAGQQTGTGLVGPDGGVGLIAQRNYDLRIRCSRGTGLEQRVAFSVNHGPEQVFVWTAAAVAGSTYRPLQVYVAQSRSIAAVSSIALGPVTCAAGFGLNAGLQ